MVSLQRIRPLPDEIRAKFQSELVITEPVQILKELIDNSLDGQSSRICVRIHWDCNWLCVTDNGDGIEVLRSSLLLVAYYSRRDKTEDIPNLAQTASTSKLQSFEKLDQIKTLGFRGEALRSIRTTANLTIRSCTSLGGAFQINFDKGQDESKTRMNDEDVNPLRGTSVYVHGLPDHRNKAATRYVRDRLLYVVKRLKLSHHSVAFWVIYDKSAFQWTEPESPDYNFKSTDTVGAALTQTFPDVRDVKAFNFEFDRNAKAQILIGTVTRPRRTSNTLLSINGRPISFEELSISIQSACNKNREPGSKSFILAKIDVEPKEVDILMDARKERLVITASARRSFLENLRARLGELPCRAYGVDTSRVNHGVVNVVANSQPSKRCTSASKKRKTRGIDEDGPCKRKCTTKAPILELNMLCELPGCLFAVQASDDYVYAVDFSHYWGSYCGRRKNVWESGNDYPEQTMFRVNRSIQDLLRSCFPCDAIVEDTARVLYEDRAAIEQRFSIRLRQDSIEVPVRFAKGRITETKVARCLAAIARDETTTMFQRLYIPDNLCPEESERCQFISSTLKPVSDHSRRFIRIGEPVVHLVQEIGGGKSR